MFIAQVVTEQGRAVWVGPLERPLVNEGLVLQNVDLTDAGHFNRTATCQVCGAGWVGGSAEVREVLAHSASCFMVAAWQVEAVLS